MRRSISSVLLLIGFPTVLTKCILTIGMLNDWSCPAANHPPPTPNPATLTAAAGETVTLTCQPPTGCSTKIYLNDDDLLQIGTTMGGDCIMMNQKCTVQLRCNSSSGKFETTSGLAMTANSLLCVAT